MISLEFARTRAQATRDAQVNLAAPPTSWVWPQRTVPLWDTDLTVFDQLRIAESATRADWRNAAESWQVDLNEIQSITRLVAKIGRVHFRQDAVKRVAFEKLATDGDSRADVYAQGLKARDVWERADPAWTVSDEETIELSTLSSLLTSSLAKQATESAKRSTWRNASAALMRQGLLLDRDSVAWYAEATGRFAAGTAAGDMIRTTVPTTARPVQPVAQAVISNLMAAGGDVHCDCSAQHATRFTFLQQTPGSPAFVVVQADSEQAHLTLHNQVPGLHRIKAFGSNSNGPGQESAVAEITVAQSAVA